MRGSLFAAAAAIALGWSGAAAAQTGDAKACGEFAQAERAVAACTRLIQAGRHGAVDTSTFHTNRGIAYRRLNQHDRALADYTAAIRLDPKNAEAHHSRGTIYYLRGQFDAVIEEGNRAVALSSKYALAYEQRGLAWYRKGAIDAAIADYDKALELLPSRALARYARGLALRGKGNEARAAADIRAAEAANPNIRQIAAALGLQ